MDCFGCRKTHRLSLDLAALGADRTPGAHHQRLLFLACGPGFAAIVPAV